MDTTPVVSLTEYRERKAKEEALETAPDYPELNNIFDASDEVLDAIEENFDDGICIGILNGQLQVSSTIQDIDTIIWMLEGALEDVRNNY